MGAIDCSKGSQERHLCSFYNVDRFPTVLLLGPNKALTSGHPRFSGTIMILHHLFVQSLCAQWLNNNKYYYRQAPIISNSIIIMMLHMFAYNYYAGNKSAWHVTNEALIFAQKLVSDRLAVLAGAETFNVCKVSAINKTYIGEVGPEIPPSSNKVIV